VSAKKGHPKATASERLPWVTCSEFYSEWRYLWADICDSPRTA